MCSPDTSRYKEFAKRGAVKFYMPCWTLDELEAVGADISKTCTADTKKLMTREAIEERFNIFGGIFRCVIPASPIAIEQAENNLTLQIDRCSKIDAFLPSTSIEKNKDDDKNISHFIMQYGVHYGSNWKESLENLDGSI